MEPQDGVELGLVPVTMAPQGDLCACMLGAAFEHEALLMEQAAGVWGAGGIERKSAERFGLVGNSGEWFGFVLEDIHA
ncbi:MAG TPA: hypothetical protein VGR73_20825 [Bryobacteraceae bacterium]|nr:hypothetical protein [Bryobacteraceae bacterium]